MIRRLQRLVGPFSFPFLVDLFGPPMEQQLVVVPPILPFARDDGLAAQCPVLPNDLAENCPSRPNTSNADIDVGAFLSSRSFGDFDVADQGHAQERGEKAHDRPTI